MEVISKVGDTIKRYAMFIAWTAFCLILGWVLFSDGCGHSKVQPAVDKKIYDTLETLRVVNKKRGDSIKALKENVDYDNSVIDEMGVLVFQADSAHKAKQTEVRILQQKLAVAKAAKDTNAQLVECDSLSQKVTELREKSDESERLSTQYVFKTERELYEKQTLIDLQGRQIEGLQKQANTADAIIKNTAPIKLPWIRGWVGPTVQFGAYNSFGADLHLMDRKDNMYKVGPRYGVGGWSVEGGLFRYLSFKRH